MDVDEPEVNRRYIGRVRGVPPIIKISSVDKPRQRMGFTVDDVNHHWMTYDALRAFYTPMQGYL